MILDKQTTYRIIDKCTTEIDKINNTLDKMYNDNFNNLSVFINNNKQLINHLLDKRYQLELFKSKMIDKHGNKYIVSNIVNIINDYETLPF